MQAQSHLLSVRAHTRRRVPISVARENADEIAEHVLSAISGHRPAHFVSRGPEGFQGGGHLYNYGGNAPTMFSDPTGRFSLGNLGVTQYTDIGGLAARGISAAVEAAAAALTAGGGPLAAAQAAASALAEAGISGTISFGGSVSYTGVNGSIVQGSISIVADTSGNIGVEVTTGGGLALSTPGASAGATVQVSNAGSIYDLQGPFTTLACPLREWEANTSRATAQTALLRDLADLGVKESALEPHTQ